MDPTPIARMFAELLHRMKREILLHTGKEGIHEIIVSAELGLAMGFAPGETASIDGVAVSVVGEPLLIGDVATFRDVERTAFSGTIAGNGRTSVTIADD